MNFKHWKQNSAYTAMWARAAQQKVYRLLHGVPTQKRIAMFHAGRCGSSVLANMLAQHPEIHWANEIFENMQPGFYRMPASNRAETRIKATIHPPEKAFFGFETKYLPEQHLREELANHSPESYVSLLQRLGFEHYILLDRSNHLRRAVSTAIGIKTNQWSNKGKQAPVTTVTLNPEKFVSYGESMTLTKFFESLEHRYQEMKLALSKSSLLELNYEEDILPDPTIGYKKTCAFIGTDARKDVEVRLRKQNTRPLSKLVENYDDIAAYLRGTRYEWMLTAD